MKRYLPICGLLAILLFYVSCQKDISTPQDELTRGAAAINGVTAECVPLKKELLIAGTNADGGDVSIINDQNNIIVTLTSTHGNYAITHISAVYGSQANVQNVVCEFNYSACTGPSFSSRRKVVIPGKMTDTFQISNSNFEADGCLFMAFFVTLTSPSGDVVCAWVGPGDTQPCGTLPWQFSFKYCKQDCTSPPPPPPPPPPGQCPPLKKDLFIAGTNQDGGDVLVTNDQNNIIVTLTSTFGNYAISHISAVYGAQENVQRVVCEFNYSACTGPSFSNRRKVVAPPKMTDTFRIPNSNFEADGCLFMAFFVTLTSPTGDVACAWVGPGDTQPCGTLPWQFSFKYCKQDCPTPPPPTPPCPPCDDRHKIQICHKADNKKFITICVDKHALKAHLAHGDKLGCCPAPPPPPPPCPPCDDRHKVQICHKAGPNKFITICVDKHAVKAHLAHGDKLGCCDKVRDDDDDDDDHDDDDDDHDDDDDDHDDDDDDHDDDDDDKRKKD